MIINNKFQLSDYNYYYEIDCECEIKLSSLPIMENNTY